MARYSVPTEKQIAAWHAGGYIVERTTPKSAAGFCSANNVVYQSIDEALAAAARLDTPESMTFVNYASAA